MSSHPALVLLDIEGTIAPVSFVRDELFPYARTRLGAYIAAHGKEPDIAGALAELNAFMPGAPPVGTLHALMDREAKLGPLKLIQGRIWAAGFADGSLVTRLYPDIAPTLRAWHAAGIGFAVYSSGSAEAQRLLLSHTPEGDLTTLFSGFFDTRVGARREAASYAAIARNLGLAPAEVLFISEVEAELTAASVAGLDTCQILRVGSGTAAAADHRHAPDLVAVAAMFDRAKAD